MKVTTYASTAVLAALLFAGGAAAAEGPYAAWQKSSDDDTQVEIRDSFNDTYKKDVTVSEDNDYTVRKSHQEDNDITSSWNSRKDIDVTKSWQNSEDNDITKTWTNSEDNDVTKSWQESTDVDVDFQIATPTQTSSKHQYQDAGHEAEANVYGSADGHDVYTQGGDTLMNAGNDETRLYGSMMNTNTNILPSNDLFIGGHNGGDLQLINRTAGRDMGDKGVFAPVGNTTVGVSGSVGNQSGASVDQRGDSGNDISDPISSHISR